MNEYRQGSAPVGRDVSRTRAGRCWAGRTDEPAQQLSTTMMKKLLVTATALIALTIPAYAEPAPDCNSPEVQNVLTRVVGGRIGQPFDLKSDTEEKRWCTVWASVPSKKWASLARMWYTAYNTQRLVYTIEWINETDGRFWVQIQ
jgi:hypothetical protein